MNKFALLVLAATLTLASPALAGSALQKTTRDWVPDGFRDVLDALPKPTPQWKADGYGGYEGTGDNAGAGWRRNRLGIYQGTGNNLGSGWQPTHNGFRGTGSLFGQECSRDDDRQWQCD